MTNVYIHLNRFLTRKGADKMLDQALAESDVEDFEEKHKIIDFMFHPLIKAYFSPKIAILKSQIIQLSNYIPKIV